VQLDRHTPGRTAILRCTDRQAGFECYRRLTGRTLT
jgi:hypothetical protein